MLSIQMKKLLIEALMQIKALSTPLRTLPWDPQEPLTQLQMAALLDDISNIATDTLNKVIK